VLPANEGDNMQLFFDKECRRPVKIGPGDNLAYVRSTGTIHFWKSVGAALPVYTYREGGSEGFIVGRIDASTFSALAQIIAYLMGLELGKREEGYDRIVFTFIKKPKKRRS